MHKVCRLILCLLLWEAGKAEAAPPEVRVEQWTSSRGDVQNSGAAVLVAPGSASPRPWTFSAAQRVVTYEPGMAVWSPPALGVANGRAILVAGSYDHNLYCLDAATGDLLWKMTAGGGIYAAPLIWSMANTVTVIAFSSDRLVYGYDAASGAHLWTHSVADFRATLGGARLSSGTVGEVSGRPALFFGHWVWDASLAGNLQEGGISAISPATGALLWRARLGDAEITAPTFARIEDRPMVFVGSTDGNLFALNADSGEILWRRTELDAIRNPPAIARSSLGDLVIMASKSGIVRGLVAGTGAELWRYHAGDWVVGSPAAATVRARPVVIFGSYDRSVVSLDLLTGKLIWRRLVRGGVFSSPSIMPFGPGARVLAAAWDHRLYGIDAASGEVRWSVYTGRPFWDAVGLESSNWSAPTAADLNGTKMAYFGSYSGTFYGFRLDALEATGEQWAQSRSRFWWSFVPVLFGVGLLAWALTLYDRRRPRKGYS
jgi:outer membrane protein assembly factor BamB